MLDQANEFLNINGLDWAMRRYAQHSAVCVAKNDMTAAWLAECCIVGLCYRLETLYSPISRIGLHFFKNLLSLRHNAHDTTGDTMLQDVYMNFSWRMEAWVQICVVLISDIKGITPGSGMVAWAAHAEHVRRRPGNIDHGFV